MRKFDYKYLPPAPDKQRFDKLMSLVLRGVFPFTWWYWKKPLPTHKFIIDKRKYLFCQFATWYINAMYRRWLRMAAFHVINFSELAIDDQAAEANPGITGLSNKLSYARCYNCPPISCRIEVFVKKNEVRPKRCIRSFCPHCHVRKILGFCTRIKRSVKAVSGYYRNLHLFRYKSLSKANLGPAELKQSLREVLNACRKNKTFLGALWYIYPQINKDTGDIHWSARILVLAGGSFELPETESSSLFTLKKIVPARTIHIYHEVARTLSWGTWPFWYNHSATYAWDKSIRQRIGGRCILKNKRGYLTDAVLKRFRKANHKKYRGRYLPFERTTG